MGEGEEGHYSDGSSPSVATTQEEKAGKKGKGNKKKGREPAQRGLKPLRPAPPHVRGEWRQECYRDSAGCPLSRGRGGAVIGQSNVAKKQKTTGDICAGCPWLRVLVAS